MSGTRFGRGVAIDGDVALIGAPEADLGASLAVGHAQVRLRTGPGVWVYQLTLNSPAPITGAPNSRGSQGVLVPDRGAVLGRTAGERLGTSTYCPSPDLLLFGLTTNADGEVVLPAPMPTNAPSGFTFHFRYWIQDPGAAEG